MVKVGDKVVVTDLPSKDVNGYPYDVVGGGGVVLRLGVNSTIIRLFDNGTIIEAEGTDFDLISKHQLKEDIQ